MDLKKMNENQIVELTDADITDELRAQIDITSDLVIHIRKISENKSHYLASIIANVLVNLDSCPDCFLNDIGYVLEMLKKQGILKSHGVRVGISETSTVCTPAKGTH